MLAVGSTHYNASTAARPQACLQVRQFAEHSALHTSGQTALVAERIGTNGGLTDDEGIFIGDGVQIVQVAREKGPRGLDGYVAILQV